MQHYFGKVENGEMIRNDAGKICEQEIKHMGALRDRIDIHEYVIMPNHIHLLFGVVGTGLSLSKNSRNYIPENDTHIRKDNKNVVPTNYRKNAYPQQ